MEQKEVKNETAKKLSKKVLVFVGVFVLVIASAIAGLVGYASNGIHISVDRELAIKLTFNDGETEIQLHGFGADPMAYDTHAMNQGQTAAHPYSAVTEIVGDSDWTGNEFTSVNLYDQRYVEQYPDGMEILSYLCHIKVDGTLIPFSEIADEHTTIARLIFAENCQPETYTHNAGVQIDNTITITPVENLVGDFDVKACHLYDLATDCP